MTHLLRGPRVSKRLRRSKVGDVPRVLRERGYRKATSFAIAAFAQNAGNTTKQVRTGAGERIIRDVSIAQI